MGFLKKIWNHRLLIFYLPISIYFNLRYLPLKQSIKIPIVLCNPKISGNGKYLIEGKIHTGMIRLGFPIVSIFRGKGIILENKGTVIFKGTTILGANSAISVGNNGILRLGNEFMCSYSGKIVCYNHINIGNRVRIGWNGLLCDTDFHTQISEDSTFHTKGYGEILIDDDVWFGSYCKIFKNTVIPSKCTVASGTVLSKKIDCDPYTLIYPGGGIKTRHTGFYRDCHDDQIFYK